MKTESEKTVWATLPGDPAQQARRAAMWSQYERPDYWFALAEQAFVHAMRRTGNAPDRELSNIIGFLVKASDYGGHPAQLSERLAPRIAQEPSDLAEIWIAVAATLEVLAQQRIAAHSEANAAMEPA